MVLIGRSTIKKYALSSKKKRIDEHLAIHEHRQWAGLDARTLGRADGPRPRTDINPKAAWGSYALRKWRKIIARAPGQGPCKINEPDPDPKRGTGTALCHWQTLRAGWYYGLLAYMWSSAAKSSSSH